jgi:hypothetical protein
MPSLNDEWIFNDQPLIVRRRFFDGYSTRWQTQIDLFAKVDSIVIVPNWIN